MDGNLGIELIPTGAKPVSNHPPSVSLVSPVEPALKAGFPTAGIAHFMP